MPYIIYNKITKHTKLFGSLPQMCHKCGISYKKMQYIFRTKKQFKNETFEIIKVELERGGKKQNNEKTN